MDLREQIKGVPNMPTEDYPVWNPHLTLANHLEPSKIIKIWDYVSTLPKCHFVISFDNVALFRSEGNRTWRVDEIFPLKKF